MEKKTKTHSSSVGAKSTEKDTDVHSWLQRFTIVIMNWLTAMKYQFLTL
jgi:hypothetical protein